MMNKDLRDILFALNAHHVEYLVVDAYAVGVHSEPRATKDLDILIRTSKENSESVFRALADYGAPLAGLSPASFRDESGSIFQIGLPPLRIDILQHIEAIDFDEAWRDRVEALVEDDVPAHIISRDHLIRNKLAVGRLQDLADVEKIREAALLDQEPSGESTT
jgi:hypothetical protein